MYKRIFIFLFNFILCVSLVSAESDEIELSPIVITRRNFYLFKEYTLDQESLKLKTQDAFLSSLRYSPLELQSRSPLADIQFDFSLRASNFEQVVVLFNERRINDSQTAHHNSDIPLTQFNIESLGIYLSGGSSLFGSGALGGALNIVTKKEFKKENILQVSTGSHKLKSVLFGMDGLEFNQLFMRFSSEIKEADGFYYDTEYKKYTLNLESKIEFPLTDFNMFLGYQEKEFGAYDFYTPFRGFPSFEWTKTYLLNTDLDFQIEDFFLKGSFLWRRHYDKFLLDKTLIRSRYLNHHQTDIFSPLFYLRGNDFFGGIFGMGFEYTEEKIISTNLGKHKRLYHSLFMEERKDFDNFSYSISYRSDRLSNIKNIHTGTFNINYILNKNKRLTGGFSRSIRMPSFTELYYNDPTTEGNSFLLPEEAYKYDLGYEYNEKDKEFLLSICTFLRDEKNAIDWLKEISSESKWKAKNITSTQSQGIEMTIKKKINKLICLDLFYTYIDKKIKTKQYNYKYGLNYNRHRFFFVLDFSFKRYNHFIGFSYNKPPQRDGWFILDTNFIYRPKKENMEFFFDVSNLLNVEYQNISGIPSPKRNFQLGIRFYW
ncbi:MAG: TonB-dependent receptor [Candidatus Omnitrophica bacterium]|nr:TonB-dependent receptor [Candidatus Omnitrophota bacterium]